MLASSGGLPLANLLFTGAVVLVWTWMSAVAVNRYRQDLQHPPHPRTDILFTDIQKGTTMRYIVLLKAQQLTNPPPELFEAIMKLGEEATAAGALIDNAGLAQGATGARVRLSAGELSVMDGPFAEAKEFISYAQYEVRSKAEAVEWASRFMAVHERVRARLGGRMRGAQGLRSRGFRPARPDQSTGRPRVPRSGAVPTGRRFPAVVLCSHDGERGAARNPAAIEAVWRIESARLIAGLARVTGDIGLAEDLAQDALVVALEQWPNTGIPPNPAGWLMTTAKNRGIDAHRRRAVHQRKLDVIGRADCGWRHEPISAAARRRPR